MSTREPIILLSNDDGYHAPGLAALREALGPLGRVVVCAPEGEQSASSHSLTLHRPLRLRKVGPDAYSVDGTPTDSVLLGIHEALKGSQPDLVVAGINAGPNLGDDISYSGTVAAALEGTIFGIPSVALSLAARDARDFSVAQGAARDVAQWVLKHGLPQDVTLNVNVPAVPPEKIQGRRITVQGKRHFEELVEEKRDPRGIKYYWIAGTLIVPEQDARSDLRAIAEHYISITPLRLDLTAFDALEHVTSLARPREAE